MVSYDFFLLWFVEQWRHKKKVRVLRFSQMTGYIFYPEDLPRTSTDTIGTCAAYSSGCCNTPSSRPFPIVTRASRHRMMESWVLKRRLPVINTSFPLTIYIYIYFFFHFEPSRLGDWHFHLHLLVRTCLSARQLYNYKVYMIEAVSQLFATRISKRRSAEERATCDRISLLFRVKFSSFFFRHFGDY